MFLKSNSFYLASANQAAPGILGGYTISATNPAQSHDAIASTAVAANYVKLKTITINNLIPASTTIRVYFEAETGASLGRQYYAKIYKNGATFGTERSGSNAGWDPYTEDLAFASGDTLELWAKVSDVADTARVQNFRILGETLALRATNT
jgi:hypothetical protein